MDFSTTMTVHEVWRELGTTMRLLRQRAGLSLRQVERISEIGRGTISQVENGHVRPSLRLVEWYDAHLHADGLLLSTYAEARLSPGIPARARPALRAVSGDRLVVEANTVPAGVLVAPGADLEIGWRLRNAGTVAWQGRSVWRVGAVAATRLIASPVSVPLPDCAPGGQVDVRIPVTAPQVPGTVAAYWHVVDKDGHSCLPVDHALAVVVVVAAD